MRTRTFKKQNYDDFIRSLDKKFQDPPIISSDLKKNKENVEKNDENKNKKKCENKNELKSDLKNDLKSGIKNKENNAEINAEINELTTSILNEFNRDLFKSFDLNIKNENKYIDPNKFLSYKIFDSSRINNKYLFFPRSVIKQHNNDLNNNLGFYENIVYKSPKRNFNFQEKSREPNIPKIKVTVEADINTLDDLIKLTETYPLDERKEYNVNMEGLHKIKTPLMDLNNMVGMKALKENVVDQILYYIQYLNTSGDFMHTVIYGPPGTGKTEIAKIIGDIFSKLGVLKKGTFKKVTRSDLVAGYLGQTAIKTRDVVNECLGGVLFIDEAYALGNNEKRDSFSKECIDTLCEALSNHKDNLMVIIAGYENELKECFFNYNQGLDSRFTWRFKTDDYKGEELFNIFLKKVKEIKWEIATSEPNETKITSAWFEKNIDYFKFFGRDIETLLAKTKIVHARRVFCKPQSEKMKITIKDLEKGFELYLRNDEVKKRKENENLKNVIKTMYV